MLDKITYVQSLKWRLEQIKSEIVERQREIQTLFKTIEEKQEQVKHIAQLLASEGEHLEDPELASIADVDIAASAYHFLGSLEDKLPQHYTKITKEIMSQGILIPGKNPQANLLSHISRDKRFVRTAPGTYGLQSWGLNPAPKRKRKKRRKR